jgi:hypothetical protein
LDGPLLLLGLEDRTPWLGEECGEPRPVPVDDDEELLLLEGWRVGGGAVWQDLMVDMPAGDGCAGDAPAVGLSTVDNLGSNGGVIDESGDGRLAVGRPAGARVAGARAAGARAAGARADGERVVGAWAGDEGGLDNVAADNAAASSSADKRVVDEDAVDKSTVDRPGAFPSIVDINLLRSASDIPAADIAAVNEVDPKNCGCRQIPDGRPASSTYLIIISVVGQPARGEYGLVTPKPIAVRDAVGIRRADRNDEILLSSARAPFVRFAASRSAAVKSPAQMRIGIGGRLSSNAHLSQIS